MVRLTLAGCLSLGLVSAPAFAEEAEDIAALYEALRLPEILEIMHDEGVAYGEELQTQILAGQGGEAWDRTVERIYDVEWMETTLSGAFSEALDGVDVSNLVDFFTTKRGQEIITLEVTARRALLDPGIEEASKERLAELEADEDPRLAQIRRFAEVNDLVETNVVGALNSNYAFYIGLLEGEAFGGSLSEEQILSDVWSQEEEIRADTEEWLYSYLALAYQPLSDDDLDAYIALSETEDGQVLNTAIFKAFEVISNEISLNLGKAAAYVMSGEDI